MGIYIHDPEATLAYGFDWTNALASGVTIASSTWSADEGIDLGVSEIDGNITSVLVSGGTHKTNYVITNHVVFSDGAADDRSHTLKVRHR
jgi:hypothetical protein